MQSFCSTVFAICILLFGLTLNANAQSAAPVYNITNYQQLQNMSADLSGQYK